MHEYLEGSLSPGKLEIAASHLAECADCREGVGRERLLADSLSTLMRRQVEPLTLRPEARRRIVRALESERTRSAIGGMLGWWRELAWPKFAAAGLAVLALLLGLVLLAPVAPRSASNRPDGTQKRSQVSIRVTCSTPQYTFRQAGDVVIDSLSSRTHAVNVKLGAGGAGRSSNKHQERTLPL